MSYTLKVSNKNSATQNVAVYQKNPNATDALPLVWFRHTMHSGNNYTFTWDIAWALNWGTTPVPLDGGVLWSSGGTPVTIEPDTIGGKNQMTVSYEAEDFVTKDVINNSHLSAGKMQVITDGAFTSTQATNMSIAVYMDGKAALAMQGKPNGTYTFDTHPTYYLCVTDHEEGVAVTGDYVSSATEVKFEAGITELAYELTDGMLFKPV
jgi:hypothetical protein